MSKRAENRAVVAVVQNQRAKMHELLAAALAQARFWDLLEAKARSSGTRDITIAIKPDLDFFEASSMTGANPALVEAFILTLRGHGYASVVVIDGRNERDDYLHNRGGLCVPEMVGYHFEAPPGHPYDFAFVGDNAVAIPIHPGDESSGFEVCGAWATADFRISIGKNRTDELHAYAGCVQNLLGLIPAAAHASRWLPEDRCVHLLRHTPAHFALLDALTSYVGAAGSRGARSVQTDTLIASESPLLTDWIAALKGSVDPYASRVMRAALQQIGLPKRWTLTGDAAPWPNWCATSPSVLASTEKCWEWPELAELTNSLLQRVDREHFPFRDMLLDQLNATITSRLYGITDQRLQDSVMMLLRQLLGLVANWRNAYLHTARKQDVARSRAPIMLDVQALPRRAYDETEDIVEAQAHALTGAAPDARGFQVRSIDNDIYFEAGAIIDCSFAHFVKRVDVSRAIQYMNDYVGGQSIGVSFDARGRVTRQVERNVYLPQPNWISVFGGAAIDVEKVERIRYSALEQTIWWRTVRSANGSAHADDGRVTFQRTPSGDVEVRIFARQRFRQPGLVAATRVQNIPSVYRELVADAYAHFFDGTISNMRAACEGRDYRIGKEADPAQQENAIGLRALLGALLAVVWKVIGTEAPASAGTVFPIEIDALGFQHFPGDVGPRSVIAATDERIGSLFNAQDLNVRGFIVELGHAVVRDIMVSA